MTAPALLLLVRHAWAGERGAVPDDRTRPLDDRGRHQAAALLEHLDVALQTRGRPRLDDHRPPPVLLSSPLLRCTQTLAPMASALGLEVVTDHRLAEVEVPLSSRDGWPDAAYLGTRAVAALDDVMAQRPGTAALVVCAHGEILPALVGALAGRGELVTPSPVDLTAKRLPKGATWLLDGHGGDGSPMSPRTVVELDPPA